MMGAEYARQDGIDIFVSFSSPDKEWADWIAWTLSDHGYSVLYQPWDFTPGTNFVLQMNKAAASTKTVAVLSENYLSSKFAQPEWAAAFAQDPTGFERRLIPVRISECELEGTLLAQIVYIDLAGIFDKDLAKKRLLDGLAGSAPSEAPEFPSSAGKPPPFPGTIADPATRVSDQRSNNSLLPPVGLRVPFSTPYVPPSFRGLQVQVENPLVLDFILDSGDTKLTLRNLGEIALRLTKYFLTALTVPDEHLWVNLSPYEEDKVIPEDLGQTQMGVDLLMQDYILKQVTSTALYPEKVIGQAYWQHVYEKTGRLADPSTIDTYNKVWVTPRSAKIIERGQFVIIEDRKLQVQLEKDYLSSNRNVTNGHNKPQRECEKVASDIFKEMVLPKIAEDVNQGGNFAVLRQIYDALLLSVWYKEALRRSIISDIFVDRGLTTSMRYSTNSTPESVYMQYLEAFRTGVFEYIREDTIGPDSAEAIPRKYFSGGFTAAHAKQAATKEKSSRLLLQSVSTSGVGRLYWVRMNLSDDDKDIIDERFYSADKVGGIDFSGGKGFDLSIETEGEGIRFNLSDKLNARLLNSGMANLRPSVMFVKEIRGNKLEISNESDPIEMLADVTDAQPTLSPSKK